VKLKRIKEGESELLVPDVEKPEEGEVFYNPSQALSRDISVLFYLSAGVDVLDGMAGTGARAIRLARYGLEVTANDFSGRAVTLIKKNAKLNGVKLEVTQEDVRVLLHQRKFGAVDIDPFGTPAPFVHCALDSAVRFLGIVSTDTSALTGTYPRVSRRRYGAIVRKLPNYPEVGVRVLAGFVVREAAKLEIAARPVFAHIYRHYYRIYFSLRRGARAADSVLQDVGVYKDVGPIFLGNLWDAKLVARMLRAAGKVELAHTRTEKHLRLIAEELRFPLPYYDVHAVCKELGKSCPSMEQVLEATGGVRTHFTPTGFRCGLDEAGVTRIMAKL
jgi:tRNA (guanine26-N2/guanine27-N2)-dimethyltransferase